MTMTVHVRKDSDIADREELWPLEEPINDENGLEVKFKIVKDLYK